MTETQLRFLRSIAERLPLERVVELHLFPPMRQGALETGIAVIAAERAVEAPLETSAAAPDDMPVDLVAGVPDVIPVDAAAEACDPTEDASREAMPVDRAAPNRHTVFTARYRLTLKGPERGKWELSVMEEADAPLLTIEMVVRGVQRRTGDGAEPERIDPAGLRELLEAPAA